MKASSVKRTMATVFIFNTAYIGSVIIFSVVLVTLGEVIVSVQQLDGPNLVVPYLSLLVSLIVAFPTAIFICNSLQANKK
jgi:hypothetical protein